MPRLAGNGASGLPKPGIFRRELAYFAVVTESHRFSPRYACLGDKLFTKSVIPSMEKSRLVMVNIRESGRGRRLRSARYR
jgi:hypothetical protein